MSLKNANGNLGGWHFWLHTHTQDLQVLKQVNPRKVAQLDRLSPRGLKAFSEQLADVYTDISNIFPLQEVAQQIYVLHHSTSSKKQQRSPHSMITGQWQSQ